MTLINKSMRKAALGLFLITGFLSMSTFALTTAEIKAKTHVTNLEAAPHWFQDGQPIDFIVTVKYDGGTQDGFEVGVFHEGRLVGWAPNKRFNTGQNTFKVRDPNFKGDAGAYIVKIRYKGAVFTSKRFVTNKREVKRIYYTINPSHPFPRW